MSRFHRSSMYLLLASVFLMPALGVTQDAPITDQHQRLFFEKTEKHKLERLLNGIGLTTLSVGRSYALIAGVTQYPNLPEQQRNLAAAAVDIDNLKLYLKNQEYFDEIVVLKDGDMTLDNLSYFLEIYFPSQLARSPHSRFLFAYSGHGYAEGTGDTARGFLLKNSARNLQDTANAISLSDLRSFMNPVIDSAEKVLVLINSCQSGAFLARKPFGASPLGPGEKGAHAIMASRTSQRSWSLPDSVGPGSVFFEKIFAALGGVADTSPRDGVVTYHELDTYLHSEIPLATNGNQNPVEGDISRNVSEGEFYFLNRSRQVALHNVADWAPKNAVALGEQSSNLVERGREAFQQNRFVEAFDLFNQAAVAGNADAMGYVGSMYEHGQGTGQNIKQAQLWYQRGADAQNASAMCALGTMYLSNAIGMPPRSDEIAQGWFQKAAELGNAQAMRQLGWLYESNRLPRNFQIAKQWYENALADGLTDATVDLGRLYLDPNQTFAESDPRQARPLFEKAAAAGNADAMFYLGFMYHFGRGVPKDKKLAREWFTKAAASGNQEARRFL
jgi:TPR repeat protein